MRRHLYHTLEHFLFQDCFPENLELPVSSTTVNPEESIGVAVKPEILVIINALILFSGTVLFF